MKLEVLMAKNEGIVKGKRIDFELDQRSRLYIASCGGTAFGVAKKLMYGKKQQLKQMGHSFSGIAVKVIPERRHMEVKIHRERRKSYPKHMRRTARQGMERKAVEHESGRI